MIQMCVVMKDENVLFDNKNKEWYKCVKDENVLFDDKNKEWYKCMLSWKMTTYFLTIKTMNDTNMCYHERWQRTYVDKNNE